jgi:hypothetical protein
MFKGAPMARFATTITSGRRIPEALNSASCIKRSPWLLVAVNVRAPVAEAPMSTLNAENSDSTGTKS